jgi:hypothetical protein
MSGLLGALGIIQLPADSPGADNNNNIPAAGSDASTNVLAQLAEMRKMVEVLMRAQSGNVDVGEASRAAAAALHGGRAGGADNPSHIFNLGSNNNSYNHNPIVASFQPMASVATPSTADSELVKALTAAGVSAA